MIESRITIVGLQAQGGVLQNLLQWAINDPNRYGLDYLQFHHAEVWRADNPLMTGEVRIDADVSYTAHQDGPVPRGATYYYRVRAIDQSGNPGPFSAVVSATEISGDVLLEANGYWKHPSGLYDIWGISTVGATLGEASSTLSLSGAGTLRSLTAIVSADDGAIGPTFPGLATWSVTVKNLIIAGPVFSVTWQVRKIEANAAGAVVTRAATGTIVLWRALASRPPV